ncbi:MAG: succinate dehydrogenase, cytochrome b556 subunit [Pseudomonadota bacterium]
MPNVNRGSRPLSPHLSIYAYQITWVLSILHRATGCALLVGVVLVVWWLFAAATGPDAFAVADNFLSSWLGGFVLLGSLFALSYHFLNGVRHLFWDAGYGFEIRNVTLSGWAVVIGSFVMTGGLWLLALL